MAWRGAFPGEDKGKIDNGRSLSGRRDDTGDDRAAAKAGPAKRARRRATATSHSELGEKLIAGVPARSLSGRRDDTGDDRAAAKAGPAKRARRRATATSHSELGEKLIAGVPARIMRPRLVFISCLVAICAFGLLMVFSASSVEALKEQGSSWYYLFRQAIFMGIGFAAFTLIGTRSIIPWRAFRTGFVIVLWGISVVLLVVVLIVGAGGDTWGASRWIPLGFFNLQPAEFAKPAIIALAAKILSDYYEDCSTDTPSFLFAMAVCLGVPAFRRRATATSHSELGEKLIAGVPARIMRPRLVFISCLVAICAFGLLMVFSASSVEALKEQGSSWYYLFRQAIFMGIGFVAFTLIGTRSIIPWRAFRTGFVNVLWGISVVLLVVVLIVGAGGDTWGASRWIPLGFFNLQPAEFAKPAIIALAAKILADYYEDCSTDTPSFLFAMAVCLGVPAFLIIAEPDLGTTIIVAVTVFAMAYTCGISYKLIGMICVVLFVAVVGLAIASPYRFARLLVFLFARLLVFLDPWSDPYGDGYQATLAIMAFASGGPFGRGIGYATMKYNYLPEAHNDYILAIIGEELGFVGTALFVLVFLAGPFGRGIGYATMKYNYLPEAHNDYILAIIGEELGFVGTALFVLVFLAMIAAGFYIARRSPTLHGQLVATGSPRVSTSRGARRRCTASSSPPGARSSCSSSSSSTPLASWDFFP